jgi:hypothetical protein
MPKRTPPRTIHRADFPSDYRLERSDAGHLAQFIGSILGPGWTEHYYVFRDQAHANGSCDYCESESLRRATLGKMWGPRTK